MTDTASSAGAQVKDLCQGCCRWRTDVELVDDEYLCPRCQRERQPLRPDLVRAAQIEFRDRILFLGGNAADVARLARQIAEETGT